ncbi:MAG TPA: HlyD family efflux transporter periplasmic adaptor subunit, partial [Longimicrobium sp.]
TPGQLLLEVAELGEWRINLAVSERDVQRIKVGDSVKVEVQAWEAADREQLRGHVTYVSPEPLAAQMTGPAPTPGGGGVYRVVAELDRQQLATLGLDKLRRGYTVQGSVITRSGLIITLLWNYLTEKFVK